MAASCPILLDPDDRLAIRSAADALALFAADIADRPIEEARIAYLGEGRRLIALCGILGGSEHAIDLPVAGLIAGALRMGASAMVVAHNHPSGDPAPSAADIAATRRLAEAGAVVNVALLDHLILAGDRHVSLRGMGLL